jgi:hypothetical protein
MGSLNLPLPDKLVRSLFSMNNSNMPGEVFGRSILAGRVGLSLCRLAGHGNGVGRRLMMLKRRGTNRLNGFT